jgi:hypothetical protein
MNLGTHLTGVLLDLTKGTIWKEGNGILFPYFRIPFYLVVWYWKLAVVMLQAKFLLPFDVRKWGIFGCDSSHSFLSNTSHVLYISMWCLQVRLHLFFFPSSRSQWIWCVLSRPIATSFILPLPSVPPLHILSSTTPCPEVSAHFTVSCLFNDNAKKWVYELIANLSFRDPFVCVRQIFSAAQTYTKRRVSRCR